MTAKRFPIMLVLTLTAAGCATQPPLDTTGAAVDLAPYRAAESSAHDEATVIWGGMIIDVDNRRDSTEIAVIAYPLDARQRPMLKAPTQGRFLAVIPGYVEAFDYPSGRFVTFRGRMLGTRETLVGEKPYTQPLLRVETAHVWPAGFQDTGPRISFGVGVGIH
jgi:outer membrane lipoprotein